MQILFSPSEAKYRGGSIGNISKNNYIFPELYEKRVELLHLYADYIATSSTESLYKLFGTKKDTVVEYYSQNIFTKETMKTIERYDGVAYDYLKYETLKDKEKEYIDKNVIIFSNLFGPLRAGDKGLPDYKLKQGEKIGELSPEKFYKDNFTQALDEILTTEHYLDLRAGFYHKFYKPSSPHTTLKFLKDGKVVSHWAKAYRGMVLREVAIHNITTIEEFKKMNMSNLTIREIVEKGYHREIVYDIAN